MTDTTWPYPTTPEPKRSSAPLAWVLVSILAVGGTAAGMVQFSMVQERDQRIENLGGVINDLNYQLEQCNEQATAYKDANIAFTESVSDYLSAFPFGELDLTEATRHVEDANAFECVS
ncbi:hypothetical protein [Microbacterium sp. MPKO10]|uniref:hypothetical protein n=1 Tax=Microbacterium sp. MPKO10 TaxID=2989818 RepID=UPI002236023B|nr:hypothetical protein [Microbacterium sp. MPKO10]MCW4458157.1 hypothetical protein [Microbacterium sp. MPKO10]